MKKSIINFCLATFLILSTQLQAQSWGKGITGEGEVVKKSLDVGSFDGVSFGLAGNIEVRQGNSNELVVEGQPNILDNIRTEIKNGTLYLKFDKNVKRAKNVNVYIVTPTLKKAVLSGSGNFTTQGSFDQEGDVYIALSGSGNMVLNMSGSDFSTKISGSGNMELNGNGNSNEVKISGSGNLKAQDFQVRECSIVVSGSGNCKVNATDQLNGSVSGSGNVWYKGNPKVKARVSGSGKIESI